MTLTLERSLHCNFAFWWPEMGSWRPLVRNNHTGQWISLPDAGERSDGLFLYYFRNSSILKLFRNKLKLSLIWGKHALKSLRTQFHDTVRVLVQLLQKFHKVNKFAESKKAGGDAGEENGHSELVHGRSPADPGPGRGTDVVATCPFPLYFFLGIRPQKK